MTIPRTVKCCFHVGAHVRVCLYKGGRAERKNKKQNCTRDKRSSKVGISKCIEPFRGEKGAPRELIHMSACLVACCTSLDHICFSRVCSVSRSQKVYRIDQ